MVKNNETISNAIKTICRINKPSVINSKLDAKYKACTSKPIIKNTIIMLKQIDKYTVLNVRDLAMKSLTNSVFKSTDFGYH